MIASLDELRKAGISERELAPDLTRALFEYPFDPDLDHIRTSLERQIETAC